MAHKSGLAIAGTTPWQGEQAPLAPNDESDGMRLVKTALAEGRIVSTKGVSKDEYVARLKSRKG